MDSKRKALSKFLSELTENDLTLSSKFSSDWESKTQKSVMHRNLNIGITLAIVFGYTFIFQIIVTFDIGFTYLVISIGFAVVSVITVLLAFLSKIASTNNRYLAVSIYSIGFCMFVISLKIKNQVNDSSDSYTTLLFALIGKLQEEKSFSDSLFLVGKITEETITMISLVSCSATTIFSSFIFCNVGYLIVHKLKVLNTAVFIVINLVQLIWVSYDLIQRSEFHYLFAGFGSFLSIYGALKYYLNTALEGLNTRNLKLSKIEHFYYEWIIGLDLSYCLIREGKVVFSNSRFENTIGDRRLISELVVHDSFTSQVSKGMSWEEVYTTLNSLESLDFSKLGVLKLEDKYFECRLTKYSVGFMEVFLSDITNSVLQERRKIEEKYRKTVFAKIAHEFKTPITNIVLLIDKVMQKGKDQALEELQMMKGLGDYVIFLVSDITSYFGSGTKLKILPEMTQIEDVCKFCFNVLSSLVETKSSEKKKVKAFLDLRCRLTLNIDQIRLKQVILNLISNSAKFTTCGNIKLSCFEESDHIVLSVEDEGVGISADKLDQLRNSEEIKFEVRDEYNKMGSGLGLGISKQICDEMGLSFEIESALGKGTKTTVKVPKKNFLLDEPLDTTIETVLYEAPYILINPTEAERPAVIIAEDNSVIRKSIRSLIEQLSSAFNKEWLVIEVEDGIFALSEIVNLALEGRKIDFLITDEFMDFLDGSQAITLLKILMNQQKIPKFPCLSCSAFEDEAFIERIQSCGADQVIAKPASKERLTNILKAEKIL